ncbi:MvaI/BcnI family restriction endonuclease [Bifidobacterium choloepi]|uniref:MvaI/BcnI restriction endonuclease domain-containing protein n=1 Tax=Bifidobacterium choloepi TaxID=2614131 RepID=A0A6I5N7W2_9BIFI|nr:MvaI/BcnI family restriction endonuclease [Bifidobacterium choloepi]NEG69931.1 hypothetical protein [Bifidobacterium choloepi]
MSETQESKDAEWYDTATINQVHELLTNAGAESIWVKRLVRNNNSKQQVYLGGDPSDLSFFPLGKPSLTPGKSKKKTAGGDVIQIPVNWSWVTPEGEASAPKTKLCFYPQYPEVRLSGFLQGCRTAPNALMSNTQRGHEEDRCLFLGIVHDKQHEPDHVVALVTGADAPASQYVLAMENFTGGRLCPVNYEAMTRDDEFSTLEIALKSIVMRQLTPWRLNTDGSLERPYTAPNAPGLTLEAELGVGENAIPGPDFDIWELKAVKQTALDKRQNHRVTLFTPQPDRGWVKEHSLTEFVLKFGHVNRRDENGEPLSYYFTAGDFRRPDEDKPNAKLILKLTGFKDARHFDAAGEIGLFTPDTNELIAGWSYMKLLEHWQRKHNRAAYVPYVRTDSDEGTHITYGPLVTLGISTSFGLFLQAFNDGKIVFDPGHKISRTADGKWKPHARSQFRINLSDIAAIYQTVREVDIDAETTSEKDE